MQMIDEKIKELYGSKASFCEASGIEYSNYARLIKKFSKWLDTVNDFLSLLNLEIQIAPKGQHGQKQNGAPADSSDNEMD